MMSRYKPVGWRKESHRHYLAAKGIKTRSLPPGFSAGEKINPYNIALDMNNILPNPETMAVEELDEDIDDADGDHTKNIGYELMRKEKIDPMRPITTKVPLRGKEWESERKWDGTRMLAFVKDGKVLLMNRRAVDKTKTFPEMQEAGREVKGDAVLDGEIVVFKNGKDDFRSLAERDHLKDKVKIEQKMRESPATYEVFDVLERNGRDVRGLPFTERKRLLDGLIDEKGRVKHDNVLSVAKARREGAEGVVFKKQDSVYVEGKSRFWQKYKFRNEADVAVLGYEKGGGKRKGLIGALKVGVWDEKKKGFRSVGKVGTGFKEQDLKMLTKKVQSGKPFVVRVKYLKLGSKGNLREPSFIGEREDYELRDTHV